MSTLKAVQIKALVRDLVERLCDTRGWSLVSCAVHQLPCTGWVCVLDADAPSVDGRPIGRIRREWESHSLAAVAALVVTEWRL